MRDVTIGELAAHGVLEFGDGYRTKRAEHGRPGFRILRVADVSDGFITPTGDDFVAETHRRQIGAKLSEEGDVILTTKGTVGRVASVPRLDEHLVYSPQLCYFRVRRPDVLNRRFLHFWFKSPQFAVQASHRANNTDMAAYINMADIRSLVLALPDIREQRAIAEVLGALDDKIAANQGLLSTVESLSDAHYLSSISLSQESFAVGDAAEFHNRRRIPLSSREREERPGSVPYYGAAGVVDYIDESLFSERLVLVGEDGTVLRSDGSPVLQYIWGPSWVNNHAHVLTGRNVSTEVLYVALKHTNVTHIVTGAVQPKINMKNLKSLQIDLPSGQQLSRLSQDLDVLAALTRTTRTESERLAETRDTLLPLLMSGKVRVKDVEKQIEEAV